MEVVVVIVGSVRVEFPSCHLTSI